MEAAGFGLTVAAVLATFQSVTKAHGDLASLWHRNRDITGGYVRLQIAQHNLEKFQQAQLRDPSVASKTERLFQTVLKELNSDLERLQHLLSRHGSSKVAQAAQANDQEQTGNSSQDTVSETATKLGALKTVKRLAHGETWLATDRQELLELMARITQWNADLEALLTDVQRQRVGYEMVSESIANNSLGSLERIEQATEQQYPAISQSAALKRMTLRSRAKVQTLRPGQAALGSSQWKISLDSFQLPPKRPRPGSTKENAAADAIETTSNTVSRERVLAMYGKTLVMIEWRDSFRSEESYKQFEYRLDNLVHVLRKMAADEPGEKYHAHRTPPGKISLFHCLGWTATSATFERVGLVFDLTPPAAQQHRPASPVPPPVLSLHQLLPKTRSAPATSRQHQAPSLGDRFGLAYALALNMGNLCSIGWVHKEFRSDNVVFRNDAVAYEQGAAGARHKLARPFIVGLTYARPSSNTTQDLSLLSSDPAHALYRPQHQVVVAHQQRLAATNTQIAGTAFIDTGPWSTFDSEDEDGTGEVNDISDERPAANWTAAMDVYGLGIVLLEIGMWRSIQDLKGEATPKSVFVEKYLDGLVESLAYRTGTIYMNVVKKCLKLGDWVDDEERLRAFWADTLESLASCNA